MKKISKLFLLALTGISLNFTLGTFNSFAQAPVYQWAKNIGSTGDDIGYSIAVDASGNVYVTGLFQGTADFDPGAGTANLTSAGDFDIFFAKYGPNGNYIWAKSIGSTTYDGSGSIAVDGSGNVYITGIFSGTTDFDPSAATANLTSVGNKDIFFAKYGPSGNYIWAKGIGSTSDDGANSIAVDGSGNVYVTGGFWGTADFDPSASTVNLTPVGGWDIFFAKYGPNGDYLWAQNIGSTGDDIANYIVADGSGNVYITGGFNGTADFDPSASTANLTPVGTKDVFFAKYSTTGNYLWAKNIGSTANDEGASIAVDGSGNVYITGGFSGTADFDPSASTANLTSVANMDIFFAKYGASGNYLWAKSMGSTGDDQTNCISLDASGNIYITGVFNGAADFDPGAATANLTPVGVTDIFFAKYDGTGSYLWAKNIGGLTADLGNSIAVDGNGYVYITGLFESTADFDPNAGTVNLTSGGLMDIFFAKYDGNSTGIEEGAVDNEQLAVYPNPNNGKFTIQMKNGRWKMEDETIKVFNVWGEIVYQTTSNIKHQALNIELGAALPAGVYFLQVNTGEQIVNRKLVLEK